MNPKEVSESQSKNCQRSELQINKVYKNKTFSKYSAVSSLSIQLFPHHDNTNLFLKRFSNSGTGLFRGTKTKGTSFTPSERAVNNTVTLAFSCPVFNTVTVLAPFSETQVPPEGSNHTLVSSAA
ncbi:unnamed protein product [Meloidogyne enterolobii]|uniref:Uncharacterized protein n=1 Tax=Meloidogyne enterolobii TaxID=390850 RepID=A0ACB0Z5P2_MELEN